MHNDKNGMVSKNVSCVDGQMNKAQIHLSLVHFDIIQSEMQ